mmetsp:Transcript_67874/g.209861  ORF Transcript_67874/g.209861 Transcript_67874/m.209861 type:complete len:223 (-) Transcript_67874:1006-1674(-)
MTLASTANLARGRPKTAISLVASCFFWPSNMVLSKSSISSVLACSRKGKTNVSVASISLTRLLMALPTRSFIIALGTLTMRHSPARWEGKPWSLRLSMPAAKAVKIWPACHRCSRLPAKSADGLSAEPPDHLGCMNSSSAKQPVARRRCDKRGRFSNFHMVAGLIGSSTLPSERPLKARLSASSAAMEPRALDSMSDIMFTCAPNRLRWGPKMPNLGAARAW